MYRYVYKYHFQYLNYLRVCLICGFSTFYYTLNGNPMSQHLYSTEGNVNTNTPLQLIYNVGKVLIIQYLVREKERERERNYK